jgi:outer membrane cobalamin receptor
VDGAALAARPLTRPGEVLEAAPGLIATQHSGEGKANQYFLRGFNLDHGTDLALTLDGMPLNLRSHAHGQGYADVNFLIPELLAGMRVRKGPYGADQGDFATSGQLDMALVDALARPMAQASAGSFGYWRGLAAGSFALGPGTLLLAGEVVSWGPTPEALTSEALGRARRWAQACEDPEHHHGEERL